MAQALIVICSPSNLDRSQKERLAVLALPAAFHPSMGKAVLRLFASEFCFV